MARTTLLRPLANRFTALLDFLRGETVGGVTLIASAVAALAWANLPSISAGYDVFLDLPVALSAGSASFAMPLHLWVNDGLMAVFFLLVGLEIRREMTEGQLASLQRVAAPGLAALGGMAAPALIYAALNWSDPAALRGWAVPVATDIAFSLAVISVLGRRVPVALKVFLTALAIIDDLGAIVVIALFYAHGLRTDALVGAAVVWLALFGLGRAGVRALPVYLLGGVVLWALVLRSGIHATIAGVALAFAVPGDRREAEEASPAHQLEHALQFWVAWLVLPLFGLANAGLRFNALPSGMLVDPVAIGIFAGLLLGKQVGVFGATFAATRLGLARLPAGITTGQLYGAAILCGIGFTMSLFIADLAFRGAARGEEVKLAVFAGSIASALVGLAVLALAGRRAAARESPVPAPAITGGNGS